MGAFLAKPVTEKHTGKRLLINSATIVTPLFSCTIQ